MTAGVSMLNGIFSLIGDFLTGIFAFIPQMMYFVYTCCASILDFLQFVVRKLAGLDVYWVNGQKQEGDIVFSIIKGVLGIETDTSAAYSPLSTVFWSMIIFAVVILVLSTILRMITTHYNYNPDKSHPAAIIRSSVKSLFSIAIVPVVTIFGLQISNLVLKVLDQISAGGTSSTISTVYENSPQDYKNVFQAGQDSWGGTTYGSYDFFSFGAYTGTTTISGQLFEVAARGCNRVRKGSFTPHVGGSGDGWSNHGIFASTSSDEATRREEVSYMIDYAFGNNLTLKSRKTASVLMAESLVLVSSFTYFQSGVWYLGTIAFKSFSKYNVGLVWYYYNLWGFNFFIGFAGLAISLTLLINIIFGMITRLIMLLALFLVYPVLLGIEPLDDGKAFGSWKSEFVSTALMSYGAIIGMNLVFLILPFLQTISFFNSPIPDTIFNMVIMIAALLSIKKIIATFSQLIGAKDANAEGQSTKEEFKKNAFAAADKAIKVAKLAVKVAAVVYSGGSALAVEAAKAIAKKKAKEAIIKKVMAKLKNKQMKEAQENMKEQAAESAKAAQEEAKEQQQAQQEQGKQQEQQEEKDQAEDTADEQEDEEGADSADTNGAVEDSKGNEKLKEIDKAEEAKLETVEEAEENKLVAQAEKFYNSLGGDGEEDFGVDAEAAEEAKKWYDKQIASARASREKAKGSKLSASENADLEREFKDKATEKFLRESSSVSSTAAGRQQRRVEEKKKRMAEAKAQAKQKKGGLKSFLEDSTIVEIAAKSLAVIGNFTYASSGLKKSVEDSQMFETGLQTVHEFAQALGASADSIPKNKKMKEDAKKEKKKEEAKALGTTFSYSEAVATQMEQIVRLAAQMNKNKK